MRYYKKVPLLRIVFLGAIFFVLVASAIVGRIKKPQFLFQKSLPLGLEAEWRLAKKGPAFFILPPHREKRGDFQVYEGSLYFSKKTPLLKEISGEVSFDKDTLAGENLRAELLGIPVELCFRHLGPRLNFVLSDPGKNLFSLEGEVTGERFNFALNLAAGKKILGEGEIISDENDSFRIKGRVGEYSFEAEPVSSGKTPSLKVVISPASLQERQGEPASSRAGEAILTVGLSEESGLDLFARLDHVNLMNYDVLSDIHFTAGILTSTSGGKVLRGIFSASNSILDYQPFRELRLDYEVGEGECRIRSLEFGEHYTLSGEITFASLPAVDLSLLLSDAQLEDLLFLGSDGASSLSSCGKINGLFQVKGELPDPEIIFRVVGRDGVIGKVAYETAKVDFGGRWPIVGVRDSLIREKNLSYKLVGEFDFRKAGKEDALDSLHLIPAEEAMAWNGWNITRPSPKEVEAVKAVGEDFRVGFRASGNGENEERSPEETALEYELGKNQSLKMEMKGEEGALVVEHKVKF